MIEDIKPIQLDSFDVSNAKAASRLFEDGLGASFGSALSLNVTEPGRKEFLEQYEPTRRPHNQEPDLNKELDMRIEELHPTLPQASRSDIEPTTPDCFEKENFARSTSRLYGELQQWQTPRAPSIASDTLGEPVLSPLESIGEMKELERRLLRTFPSLDTWFEQRHPPQGSGSAPQA
jgi:hypothetical protein